MCEAEVQAIVACNGQLSCKDRVERRMMWCVFSNVCPRESRRLLPCLEDGKFKLKQPSTIRCRSYYKDFDDCLTNAPPAVAEKKTN